MPLLLLIGIMFLGVVLYEGARIGRLFWRAHVAASKTVRFSRERADATFRILIVGDSTSYGTGCKDPQNSLAGRLAKDFPSAYIRNLSENAINTRAVHKKLMNCTEAPYNLIFIHVGGIDTISLTPLWLVKKHMRSTLREAKRVSDGKVILVSSGSVGTAPLFRFPLDHLFKWQTKRVQDMFQALAEEESVRYVDLHSPDRRQPFENDPKRYYAEDHIHPNDEGYGIWYSHIRNEIHDKLAS